MFLFKQRDIILVSFPFTDASSSKKRPALIVSQDLINGQNLHGDFIAVAITSKIRKTDYGVVIDNGDLQNGTLPKESEVRCDKIATIDKQKAIKKFATINKTIFEMIKNKITQEVL